MKIRTAIVVAGLLAGLLMAAGQVAAALVGRYEITGEGMIVWRLDRMTGEVRQCTMFQGEVNALCTFPAVVRGVDKP